MCVCVCVCVSTMIITMLWSQLWSLIPGRIATMQIFQNDQSLALPEIFPT